MQARNQGRHLRGIEESNSGNYGNLEIQPGMDSYGKRASSIAKPYNKV